jgi:DNA polymerase-3 subunit gamma/tau
MFKKSRTVIGNEEEPPASPVEATTVKETLTVATPQVTQAPNSTEITDAMLSQAWTSYALTLPEKERALADRMKIMTPKVESRECFTISVDNQMAADLFENEGKRICEGMSPFLGNTTMKMKVVVNKVVVERHTSDKSKQYAILVEKNPLVEKLRKELDLEVSR